MTRDALEWKWSGKEQKAFDGLKLGLSNKSLGFFNTKRNTELTVDARPTGLGGVLVQYNPMDRKDCHKVANASRLLTDVERRYSQCEKEALAVVWGCEKFCLYLMGNPFVLVTDNQAVQLIFANTKSKPPARIVRMAPRLSQFD